MWREIFKNNQITVTYNPKPQPAKPNSDKAKKVKIQGGNEEKSLKSVQDLTPHSKGVFQSRDNTSIYYEVYGQGKPLLMCYGLVCRRE
ncbi:MAG: hypothetical protein ACKOA8_19005, partial [Deltaproteobacteria bacterium]